MPPDQMNAAAQTFRNRVLNDLLPTYCNDPSRLWDVAGFKQDWDKIGEIDAADFLRGVDGELVKHEGRTPFGNSKRFDLVALRCFGRQGRRA